MTGIPPQSPHPPSGLKGADLTQLQRLVGGPAHGDGAPPALDLSPVLPGIVNGPPDRFSLTQGRMHEVCGPARRVMAAWVIAALQARAGRDAPVLWLRPRWQAGGLCPHGLAAIADPRAVLTVNCPREEDLLWCMEEALRTGAAPLIIAELPRPPALTPVRRLQLAAEAGAARMGADGAGSRGGGACGEVACRPGADGRGAGAEARGAGAEGKGAGADGRGAGAPTGLILCAGDGGAAGVESRWFAAPVWRGGQPAWQLERRRARMAPPAAWVLVDGGGAGSHGQDMYDTDAG